LLLLLIIATILSVAIGAVRAPIVRVLLPPSEPSVILPIAVVAARAPILVSLSLALAAVVPSTVSGTALGLLDVILVERRFAELDTPKEH
jgi:hypothetical protein